MGYVASSPSLYHFERDKLSFVLSGVSSAFPVILHFSLYPSFLAFYPPLLTGYPSLLAFYPPLFFSYPTLSAGYPSLFLFYPTLVSLPFTPDIFKIEASCWFRTVTLSLKSPRYHWMMSPMMAFA